MKNIIDWYFIAKSEVAAQNTTKPEIIIANEIEPDAEVAPNVKLAKIIRMAISGKKES